MRPPLRPLIVSAVLAVTGSFPLPAQGPSRNHALDRANLDTTCAPCKDFYQFANGGWLKRTTIPPAYSSVGSFRELTDRNEDQLHDILEADAAAATGGKGTPSDGSWKVGEFYASCMDTVAIDRLGFQPLQPDLALIAAITSPQDLKRALGILERRAGLAPWSDGSTQDAKHASSVIAGLYQGGLTLPDREYYTKTDSISRRTRDAFVAHVTRMFVLLGDAPDAAAAGARTVLAVEHRFALASKTRVELRDPVTNYHRMPVADLQRLTPGFPWPAFFAAQGSPPIPSVDVGQPAFFSAVNRMFTSIPIADWRLFLRWRLVHAAAPSLSSPFVSENFAFDRVFSGATEQIPRSKRCLRSTDDRARRTARPGIRQGALHARGEGARGEDREQPDE